MAGTVLARERIHIGQQLLAAGEGHWDTRVAAAELAAGFGRPQPSPDQHQELQPRLVLMVIALASGAHLTRTQRGTSLPCDP